MSLATLKSKVEELVDRASGWKINTTKLTSLNSLYRDMPLTKCPPLQLENVEDMSYTFYGTKIKEFSADTSNVVTLSSTFQNCKELEEVDILTDNTKKVSGLFYGCEKLKTIKSILVLGCISNIVGQTSMFKDCSALENVQIIGIFYNLSLADSPLLSDESIQSIIDGLEDFTGGTARKITFHTDVVNKLTEEQKIQILNKNWNLG